MNINYHDEMHEINSSVELSYIHRLLVEREAKLNAEGEVMSCIYSGIEIYAE